MKKVILTIGFLLVSWPLLMGATNRDELVINTTAKVFSCNHPLAADGICYHKETKSGDLLCYTSVGVTIGICDINDWLFPKIGYLICNKNDPRCPKVVSWSTMEEFLLKHETLFTYTSDDPILDNGFCYNDECFSYNGEKLKTVFDMLSQNISVTRCYPNWEDHCPLSPSMMDILKTKSTYNNKPTQ